MPVNRNASSPHPWQSRQVETLHSGVVSVLGSATVDLGIDHNNFVPQVMVKGGTAAIANAASEVTWEYGSKVGTFNIFTWKSTNATTTTLIAATAAVNVSFIVVVDGSSGI